MNKTTLIAMGLSACIAFTATPLLAQEKLAPKPAPEADGGGHSHFTKIPATVELIWKEIQKQQGKLLRLPSLLRQLGCDGYEWRFYRSIIQ